MNIHKIVLFTFFILINFVSFAQIEEYNIINSLFQNEVKSDTIFISSEFLDYEETKKFLTLNFIMNNWGKINGFKNPSVDPILNNFNKKDFKISKEKNYLKTKKLYFPHLTISTREYYCNNKFEIINSISYPFIDEKKNWGIILLKTKHLDPNIGDSGYIYFFKKESHWVCYHRIELWLN